MKKRQKNKDIKRLLTENELKVIKLYRESDNVQFYKYAETNAQAATYYCSVVGIPSLESHQNTFWFNAEKDGITATVFLKDSAVINND